MSGNGSSGIGGPRGPQPQLPSAGDVVTADETFADDAVAAQKARKADEERRSKREHAAAQARREAQLRRVREASGFESGKEDAARGKLVRVSESRSGADGLRRVEMDRRGEPHSTVEAQIARSGALLREIDTLLREIDAAGGFDAAPAPAHGAVAEAKAAELLGLLEHLRQLEAEARDVLMQLFGGSALRLQDNPVVTMNRIFGDLESWPSRVPPGTHPTTPEQVDAFLAWVFAPPPAPENLGSDARLLDES